MVLLGFALVILLSQIRVVSLGRLEHYLEVRAKKYPPAWIHLRALS